MTFNNYLKNRDFACYKEYKSLFENESTDEEKKQRFKQLQSQINDLIHSTQGNLTAKEAEQYKKMSKEMDEINYHFYKPVTPEKLKPHPDNALPLDIIATAWNEILANKNVYDVIRSAAAGAGFDKFTDVDEVLLGINPVLTQEDLYNAFSQTRRKLKEKYGDTIKLYRATTKQMNKPTTNWATTPGFAQQFGKKVISREIPIDKIVAVHVNRKGTYHEVIVKEPIA